MKTRKQFYVFPPVMVLALFSSVLGAMMTEIVDAFSITLALAGLFSTLQAVGMFICLILSFCVFSAFNKAKLISIGSFAFAVLIALIGINENLYLLYAIFLLLGFAMNLPDNLSHALLADMSGRQTRKYITLLHGAWALVGAVAPYFVLTVQGSYKTAFLITGAVVAFAALINYFGLRREINSPMMEDRNRMGHLRKLIDVLKRRGMILFISISFFTCFVQVPNLYFLSAFGESFFGIQMHGLLVLSLYFVGVVVGSAIYARVSHVVSKYKIIIIVNIAALIVFVLLPLMNNMVVVIVLAFLGGALLSPTMPIVFGQASKAIKEDTAAASSLIFVGVGLAALIAPPILGVLGDAFNLRIAFLINSAAFIPVIILSVIMFLRYGRAKKGAA
ncbi:MAG: MFS transporter [Clostridia bacterium]|jgi:predicted MFS family arabinose efflux permease|nr:MFS transporter [Clostridia bacterium]MBT7122604.1 MFS transporter [Clostridia bacterium]